MQSIRAAAIGFTSLGSVGPSASRSHGLFASETPPDPASAIRDLMQQLVVEGQTSGAVVCVGSSENIEFHEACGFRQIEPSPIPMTVDTLFDLASLTKPLATGLSLMKLVANNSIDVSSRAVEYLPTFKSHGKEEITLEQLLIHTSGLTPDNALDDYLHGVEEAWRRIDELNLLSASGTAFRYSDVGFIVLGRIIERIAGESLDQFSRTHLYEPLGLLETGFTPSEPLTHRAVTTEQREERWMRGEVHDPRAYALNGVAGHAGLFSTSGDLARLSQNLLRTIRNGEAGILDQTTLQFMTADRTTPEGHRRGLGWDKRSSYSSNRGETMSDSAFGHGGFTGTSLWLDPELDCFVLFLGNRLHPDGEGSVNRSIGAIGSRVADARREAK